MNSRWRAQLTLGVAVLCASAFAHAEVETLEQAWRMAIDRDPVLAATAEDLDSARANERSARGARLPVVNVGAAYTRYADAPALSVVTPGFNFQSPRIFDNDDTLNRFAELKLPLFAGGSINAGMRAASAQREAAEWERARSLANLKLDVAERYVEVLRTRAALAAAAAQVDALRAHAGDVEVMAERGAVNRSDLLASKVALANADQQRMRAVTAAAQARAAYNRRLGQPLEREPQLAPAVEASAAAVPADLTNAQAQALERRSEIKMSSAQREVLTAQARAESGKRWPQIGLTAGFNHLETTILDRQDFSMVGVGFAWQLFDGGQARNRAAALRSASRAVDRRTEDLKSAIGLEVEQAWLGLAEAQARVNATREAVGQADENLRMSRELYAAELIANTQVLEAVALQLSAAANARDAVLDSAVARLRLLRATGAL